MADTISLPAFEPHFGLPFFSRKRKWANRRREAQDPSKMPLRKVDQIYPYIAILDFEATCDRERRPNPQEVIEMPVVIINSSTLEEVSRFHQYVKPTQHPTLTPFCTQLTGIEQSTVDNAETFGSVWKAFAKKMTEEGYNDRNTIFVICGDWDLKTMMPTQARLCGIQIPSYFKKWINIKQFVLDKWNLRCKGMMSILQQFNIDHVGRHHSGIDDVINITECVRFMLNRGVLFEATSWLSS